MATSSPFGVSNGSAPTAVLNVVPAAAVTTGSPTPAPSSAEPTEDVALLRSSAAPIVKSSTAPSSNVPTKAPSKPPSAVPSIAPSGSPTTSHSAGPSSGPSTGPSAESSTGPSATPSTGPSTGPSAMPSTGPSEAQPTGPSLGPSPAPSVVPSFLPSISPSSTPTGSLFSGVVAPISKNPIEESPPPGGMPFDPLFLGIGILVGFFIIASALFVHKTKHRAKKRIRTTSTGENKGGVRMSSSKHGRRSTKTKTQPSHDAQTDKDEEPSHGLPEKENDAADVTVSPHSESHIDLHVVEVSTSDVSELYDTPSQIADQKYFIENMNNDGACGCADPLFFLRLTSTEDGKEKGQWGGDVEQAQQLAMAAISDKRRSKSFSRASRSFSRTESKRLETLFEV